MKLRCEDEQYKETLQFDIDKLMEWSDKWMLKFNVEKCKAMFDTKEEYK